MNNVNPEFLDCHEKRGNSEGGRKGFHGEVFHRTAHPPLFLLPGDPTKCPLVKGPLRLPSISLLISKTAMFHVCIAIL